jgi:peptide/nickel transport system substrate-binding protein
MPFEGDSAHGLEVGRAPRDTRPGMSRRDLLRGASAAGVSISVLGPLLAACGGTESAVGGTEIRWGIPEEPDTLDAQLTPRAVSWLVLGYLGDGLLRTDLRNNPVPGLAREWKVSDGGREVTFQLREGVKFHDGTPFDADALQYTFERGLDPDTKSVLFPALVGPVARTEAVDRLTFRVNLKEPFGPLLDNFASSGGSWLQPLSKSAVAKYGSEYGRHPVSTGPWKLTQWRTNQDLSFESNRAYKWGPEFIKNQGPPRTSRLRLVVTSEDSSRVAALQAGELDFAQIPASDYDRLDADPSIDVLRFLRSGMGLTIHFNFKVPPFDDVRVRQAMHLAIDRKAVVNAAVSGQGIPAVGPLPPDFPYYWDGVEKIGYGFDPQRAAELLDAAGWTMGGDGVRAKDGKRFSFKILTIANPEITRAAQLIRQQMKRVGIDLRLDTRDIGAINPALFAHRFELSFMFWGDQDPDILYREFHSSQIDGGVNWGSYENPKLDRLLEAGRTAMDRAKRAEAYRKVQELFVREAVWLPVYAVYDLIAVRIDRLKGASLHPDGYLVLNDATVSA